MAQDINWYYRSYCPFSTPKMKYLISDYNNPIKHWVYKLPFVSKAINDAYLKGGIDSFPLAQKDILETMDDDISKKAEELANKKVSQMLGIFDEKTVVTYVKRTGAIYIGGELADEGRLASLKAEAEYFEQSDLWKILNSSVDFVTRQIMFEKSNYSENFDDLKNGKSILYTLSFQNNILNTFKTYTQKQKTPSQQ